MTFVVFIATIAELLANPPAPYVQELSPGARSAYEANRESGAADVLAALDELIARGDMSAAEFAGELYASGALGIGRDARKACDYFELASAHRADAAHNLATCFYKGDGRAQDMVAAREWYTRASAGGWAKAHCALGNMLIERRGGEADVAGGLALCRLAAELGDADAQTDLAGYQLMGDVTAKDVLAARLWLEKAAAQDQANAAFLLGQIHANGDGTPKNTALAGYWWRKAYEGGRADAAYLVLQAIVAEMIDRTGAEPVIDRSVLPQAIAWAELAAARDPDPATRERAADLLRSMKRLQESPAPD